MKPIRNSSKAVIVRNGALLCIQKADEQGIYHILPGGGQERGESLHDALRRECREEMAVEIVIGDLCFVRDYISGNHENAEVDPYTQQVEFMFGCALLPGEEPWAGPLPDEGQIDIAWVPLSDLVAARLYPIALARVMASEQSSKAPVYLGDVN